MKHVRTISELEPSIKERNIELDVKIGNIELKRFGLVFDKITSMKLEKLKQK